ncbi:MAG TPA: LuxR C-terminal-related transcriptional regulator [Gemmatimonadaceae bacterium]|nr:LuxR C-terminal-related transcriptional regulator [Gemmatimonadaceae bacterium]
MPRARERSAAEVRHIIRVFVSVHDPGRRASLTRALRGSPLLRFVDREDKADVVVADVERLDSLTSMDQHVPARPMPDDDSSASSELTPREREVLLLVAAGMGNAHIGERLGISKSTVKYHLGAVFEKLGVHTRAEAVTMGLRKGIVLL